jgi:hypothetical protein
LHYGRRSGADDDAHPAAFSQVARLDRIDAGHGMKVVMQQARGQFQRLAAAMHDDGRIAGRGQQEGCRAGARHGETGGQGKNPD